MNLAGIDVANQTFDIHMRHGDRLAHRQFNNTPGGHRQAIRWLRYRRQPARVCLEATGIYHLQLALALHHAEGIELMVLNPRASRRFAEAQMVRAKTDKVDAGVLLQFLERMPFCAWQAPDAVVLELQSQARRLGQLNKDHSRERNRLHAAQRAGAHTRRVQQDLRAHLKQLARRIARLEHDLLELIRAQPALAEDLQLIDSAPGFAAKAASQVLAEIKPLSADMSARQWVAQAGLDPKPVESGSSLNAPRQISKHGNARLRAALFFPAMVASQRDPHVKAFYQSLLKRGKSPRQAQIAVMRKLLHAIWGMLHHRTPWDGNRFYRLAVS